MEQILRAQPDATRRDSCALGGGPAPWRSTGERALPIRGVWHTVSGIPEQQSTASSSSTLSLAEHRRRRARRHPRRRPAAEPSLPVDGAPGTGQDDARAPVPARRRRARRAGLYVTLSESRDGADRGRHARTAGRSTAIDIFELAAGRRGDAEESVHDLPSRRGRAAGDDRPPCSRRSSAASPRSSCSTRCPRCACSRATRCASAGRSSRSSSSSPAATAPCCCSTTRRRPRAICSSTASRTA